MNGFVIHKRSRAPGRASYSGITWDVADMRDLYRPTYDDPLYADALAQRLSKYNPVGFQVSPATPEEAC